MSKRRRKRRRKEGEGRYVGRPKILSNPLPNKDLDSTVPFIDDFSTEECETDIGEFIFNFNVEGSKEKENMAGAGGSSPSSPSSSSSPSPSSDQSSSSSASDSESDGDDIWNRPYVRHCYAEIRNQQLVRNLLENLYVAGCLPDFMLLVTQLASGKLSPLNIAFLLCLERAKWQSLKSTTQMRFREVTKKFWLVVYRLLKGKGLRFFSGPKNYGQVISKVTTRGKYDPDKSEINFAVPDERQLCSQDRILGRIIQPGLIDASMNMLKNHKDIVLMADCKRLAKGLTGQMMGDVNLSGHEKRPTLQEKLQTFRQDCNAVTDQVQSLPNATILQSHIDLKDTMQLITSKIRNVCQIENTERRRLLNYEKLNPNPNYKTAAKGACRSHIYDCKVFINNALDLNRSICKTMSMLQKTSCSFNPIHVSLQNQRNVQRLLPVIYVSRNSTVDAHPEWFRQHSPQWKKLRSQAHLTGSTAYNTMGFHGLSQLCNHFREFIHKKPPVPVDDATQA